MKDALELCKYFEVHWFTVQPRQCWSFASAYCLSASVEGSSRLSRAKRSVLYFGPEISERQTDPEIRANCLSFQQQFLCAVNNINKSFKTGFAPLSKKMLVRFEFCHRLTKKDLNRAQYKMYPAIRYCTRSVACQSRGHSHFRPSRYYDYDDRLWFWIIYVLFLVFLTLYLLADCNSPPGVHSISTRVEENGGPGISYNLGKIWC